MPRLMESPPKSLIEPVKETLHGLKVADPYRWLENQESVRTRDWLGAQKQYARSYLDAISGRDRIRERIREFLDIETFDSIQKAGTRYFFRKRELGKEQPSIFLREGPEGKDELLIDPAERGTGIYTAVKPLRISPDGRLLLYEIKQGGERTGTFELLDIQTRKTLSDVLPRGYLRGFAFAPDSKSFFYVHEATGSSTRQKQTAYQHIIGGNFDDDRQIFCAGDGDNLRIVIVPGKTHLGFLVFRFLDKTCTDFYVWEFESGDGPIALIERADYRFSPVLADSGQILAVTDRGTRNLRMVEVHCRAEREPEFLDLIPASDAAIDDWAVIDNRILISYATGTGAEIRIFDLAGRQLGHVPFEAGETIRLLGDSGGRNEVFFERESFFTPIHTYRYTAEADEAVLWARRQIPFDSKAYAHTQVWFDADDGTRIPMFLAGRHEMLDGGSHPTIMTAYGGYGISMTPQFSIFVAFLLERGCLFALPNIRGGSEFGPDWHSAAKGRKRKVAFGDFLSAARWLIGTGRTDPHKLAIFGGSNSGLLVGVAMTQRPELFRAVVCMVPLLDMLRYHLFDGAHVWTHEFGNANDPDDFAALLGYSPYHNIRQGIAYPATMIVSGDSDQTCNPLHARKMTARLQSANTSEHPIFLDYDHFRGHSPVLPLSERIEALTDRMAFLCDQLELPR